MVDNGKAGFACNNTHSIYEHLGPEMNLSQPMNAAANGSASTKMLNTSNHFEFMQTCSRRLHVGWPQLWCSRSSTLCPKRDMRPINHVSAASRRSEYRKLLF